MEQDLIFHRLQRGRCSRCGHRGGSPTNQRFNGGSSLDLRNVRLYSRPLCWRADALRFCFPFVFQLGGFVKFAKCRQFGRLRIFAASVPIFRCGFDAYGPLQILNELRRSPVSIAAFSFQISPQEFFFGFLPLGYQASSFSWALAREWLPSIRMSRETPQAAFEHAQAAMLDALSNTGSGAYFLVRFQVETNYPRPSGNPIPHARD